MEQLNRAHGLATQALRETQATPDSYVLRCDTKSVRIEICDSPLSFAGTTVRSPKIRMSLNANVFLDCGNARLRDLVGQVCEFMECGHHTPCDPPFRYIGILVITRHGNVTR